MVFDVLVTTSCQSRGLERGILGRIRKTKNKDLYKRVMTKKNFKEGGGGSEESFCVSKTTTKFIPTSKTDTAVAAC